MPTNIEWATEVWNPVTGCTKISEGCRNCYAETIVKRFGGKIHGTHSPWARMSAAKKMDPNIPFSDIVLHEDRLNKPLHWRKPRRIFVCSMGDLFHENVPDLFICKVLDAIEACPQHTFLVLTKRAKRMSRWPIEGNQGIIPNLWLGVSVEDQATADERIPILLQTPAAVRFVSCEPMLGPVKLTKLRLGGSDIWSALTGWHTQGDAEYHKAWNDTKLDWVICGGESGPGSRPMHPDWPRSLRDQCISAGVPFFFKQWGEWGPVTAAWVEDRLQRYGHCDVTPYHHGRIGKKKAGNMLDNKQWEQYP